jgi:hypothetical protein
MIKVIKLLRMGWALHVATLRGGIHNRILVGNPEGKKALRRPRRRWKVNIKLYLSETGGVD